MSHGNGCVPVIVDNRISQIYWEHFPKYSSPTKQQSAYLWDFEIGKRTGVDTDSSCRSFYV